MLTHNDVTVADARECFRSAAHLPVQYWGFKDIGLDAAEMEKLVADLKNAQGQSAASAEPTRPHRKSGPEQRRSVAPASGSNPRRAGDERARRNSSIGPS
jgi:hypothetical protein